MPQTKSAVKTSQIQKSKVEAAALAASEFALLYPPDEKIKTIVVDNFPALGKLAAMRFLEWIQQNPEGVISLPTGKTPEHFIKWVMHLMGNWNDKDVCSQLEQFGIDPAIKPEMKNLHFVQIDEFYPINPQQSNSFLQYINAFYIKSFGLDPKKAQLIDCSTIGLKKHETLDAIWSDDEVDLSLRYRPGRTSKERRQKTLIESIDQWCVEYEMKIRNLGGIGFFLGGIGPDGHIGFNVQGSDHYSTTRLSPTNYETQAAAASDLGGIEIARKRLVITIGLGTIAYNPQCTAIIIAAGEAKAKIVADAVRNEKNIHYPATALQDLPHARFYITKGAAKLLPERQLALLERTETLTSEQIEKEVIDLALHNGKRVCDLSNEDFKNSNLASVVLKKSGKKSVSALCKEVEQNLLRKIDKGSNALTNTRFLHTEPHHDDLMLGYLPFIVRHTRDPHNFHHFVCLTSGFTAVTNKFMREKLEWLSYYINTPEFEVLDEQDYFQPDNLNGRDRDVWQYLDGVAANSQSMKHNGIARRLLRDLIAVFDERDFQNLKDRIIELDSYFEKQYPGKKDLEYIQRLKGMSREYEAECLWGYFGFTCENVQHLRLGFYKGDIFTEDPTLDRDVRPVFQLLQDVKPDIVTVALDPEASGPDTHYKVLQTITEGLKLYEKESGRSDIKVWGYRNVWFRFHPSEVNIAIPVSLNMFSIMESSFINGFVSQKDASFPSYEHDGPFSELAQKIQVEQFQKLKTLLGREWFYEHHSPLIHATRGFVYLKEMDLQEFYQLSRELKQAAENR
ncbi:glucosamine-6-phosphate deaminase [candidate division KSB1 bacterium]|nr:glucosamine-6-phosphate deaminase [candidate division KSB1 bacterium]